MSPGLRQLRRSGEIALYDQMLREPGRPTQRTLMRQFENKCHLLGTDLAAVWLSK